jgi:hypothetical protein
LLGELIEQMEAGGADLPLPFLFWPAAGEAAYGGISGRRR